MNKELLEVVELCLKCCCCGSGYVNFEYSGRVNRFEVRIFENKPDTAMLLHSCGVHWFICQANDVVKLGEIKAALIRFLDTKGTKLKAGEESERRLC